MSEAGAIVTVPIDDAARDGRFKLVVAAEQFAIVRWSAEGWIFGRGRPLDVEPDAYQPNSPAGAA